MSSLNALRLAQKPSTIVTKAPSARPAEHLYPIFTESEQTMIDALKLDAERYKGYAPQGWFETLLDGERFVGAMALEGCIDPLDAMCDHWFIAIETGKTFQDREFYRNKALMLAYSLEASGLITIPAANHYINYALKCDIAVGISLFRIKEVVQEFQKAFNENRAVKL